jgi:hypothetical protein
VDQWIHQLLQRLPLGQTGAEEQSQAPQALCLGHLTPSGWAAIKSDLELSLKFDVKFRVVLGCAQ